MTKNILSLPQKFKIHSVLSEVLTKTKDGYMYIAPHSDESIAEACDFTCTPHNVAGVRKEMFGALVKPTTASVETRLNELEALVEELKDTPTEHVKDGLRDRILKYEEREKDMQDDIKRLTSFITDIANELGIRYNSQLQLINVPDK